MILRSNPRRVQGGAKRLARTALVGKDVPGPTPHEKAQAPGRTDRMPSHLRLAHYGPGLKGYQSGARIVRQAQEHAGPEYIHPHTASSRLAVTPAASTSTYDVRWGNPDMGIET
jgi:hypothetical protein